MATRRGKQFNSMVQDERDALTGARREDVLIAAEDLGRLGLAEGDEVVVENENGVFHGRARAAALRPGNIQMHWPEANVLIASGVLDPLGLVPDYNAIVRVRGIREPVTQKPATPKVGEKPTSSGARI
jgi:anaerobic selenocysteine-containing dehydrogenase